MEMSRASLLKGIFIMIVLCSITYSNHFFNAFHFDDSHTIVNNAAIRDIRNIPLFFKDGSTSSVLPQNQSYRPVTTTSLAIDYWLGGGYNLFVFHLSTFILFLLQGVLMILLYGRLFNTSGVDNKFAWYGALIAVTWYMLHPAIAETVNYIIARADLQSTLFMILAFVLYIYSPFCRKTYLYLLPVVVGALAKPPAIMFAPLFFFYILFFEEGLGLTDVFKTSNFKRLLSVIVKSIPAFICAIFMYWWQAKLTPKTWEAGGTSPVAYLITQPYVVFHYFQMFFVPNALSADTDWQLLPGITDWRFTVGCLFILIMLIIAFITSKKALLRPIAFGILWFFITLIPTSSIIPLAEVLNDHRMFLPFVGLCLSVSWAIALILRRYTTSIKNRLPKYKTAGLVLLFIILSGYAYATYQRNEVWSTEETLWHDVTLKSPKNGRGLMNYGLAKMAQGDYKTAGIYFNKTKAILPGYWTVYVNLGILKEATGDKATAENYFIQGTQLGSAYPDAWYFYGRFLCNQQRYTDAIPQLVKTIQLSPSYLNARLLLMKAYQYTHAWADLRSLAQSPLQIAPGNAEALKYPDDARNEKAKTADPAAKYLDLSLIYYNEGKYQQCIDMCNSALILKPGYDLAYNNICAAYNRLKEWDKAIASAKKGLTINPNNQLLKNNMAEAIRAKATKL
jgi:tetratricopeptide (TPR) repeat protein